MKNEGNIIIAINAIKTIMDLFLGPFLTVYFIKTSYESIVSLSIYNIIADILLGLGSFVVACIVKNKFKIGMFRLGIIINFVYIMTVIILKQDITNHLPLIAILSGVSASAYWFPYNMFVINKIDNSNRTGYTVKSTIVSSIVNVLCPILLGSIITVTNYELTAIIILVISLIQIILSFLLKPIEDTKSRKFNLIETIKKIKENGELKKVLIVEFLTGLSLNGSSGLATLVTILIFNTFNTDLNLGIISSIATIFLMVALRIYGKVYKSKDDKNVIIISSILPVIALIILLLCKNNVTIIIYKFIYVIFAGILNCTREIRLFNISDSKVIGKEVQAEFWAIREGFLNLGRTASFVIILLVSFTNNINTLNILMIIFTLAILIVGQNIPKIKKYEK